jgi:hypothetical protein
MKKRAKKVPGVHMPVVPQAWVDEENALRLAQHHQSQKHYRLGPKEKRIEEADIEALKDKKLTPAERKQFAPQWRGQYKTGDTRRFVLTEEERCAQYNCWMTRAKDGTTRYPSEPPR